MTFGMIFGMLVHLNTVKTINECEGHRSNQSARSQEENVAKVVGAYFTYLNILLT